MTSMSVKTFLSVANALPSNISVLLRGRHGIGKSQIIRQVAQNISQATGNDLEVIDRRLSQMSEGDVVGLPSTDGNTTRFNPPDWYIKACKAPCVLFLDELNRSTQEVMQAAFQIVLDRELNGHKLHPDTRVYSAVNSSSEYTVNEIDPALLDRFWCVDLEPEVSDWLSWAKTRSADKGGPLSDVIVEFISKNPSFLDPSSKQPGAVDASRRSWERLNDALVASEKINTPADPLFYAICTGFIGTEATIAFHTFASTAKKKRIEPEDVINNWADIEATFKELPHEGIISLYEKVSDFLTKDAKILTKQQGENLSNFIFALCAEHRIAFWGKFSDSSVITKGTDNVIPERLEFVKDTYNKYLMRPIMDVFQVKFDENGEPLNEAVIPGFLDPEKKKEETEKQSPAPQPAPAAPAKKKSSKK